jgi:hypothetical protein
MYIYIYTYVLNIYLCIYICKYVYTIMYILYAYANTNMYIYICTSTQWYTCNYIYIHTSYRYILLYTSMSCHVSTRWCVYVQIVYYILWYSCSDFSAVPVSVLWPGDAHEGIICGVPNQILAVCHPMHYLQSWFGGRRKSPWKIPHGIEKMGVSGNGVYLLFYSHFKRENDD